MTSFRWWEGYFSQMRPWWGAKKGPKKQGTTVKLACMDDRAGYRLWDLLSWNSLSLKKKSSETAALFHWQWCNAGDTPGREGPARSVTAWHVHGVSRAAPHQPTALTSAGTSSRASFSSQYLYVTAGSMFLEVTHSYCTCTISKTPPSPLLFAVL